MFKREIYLTEKAWFTLFDKLRGGHVLQIANWDIMPIDFIPKGEGTPTWKIQQVVGSVVKGDQHYSVFCFNGTPRSFDWFMKFAEYWNIGVVLTSDSV